MAAVRALPPDPVAPWAEVAPGYGRMTVADLLALPDDDGRRYEVVDGVLARVGSSVYKVTRMAEQLFATLLAFVVAHDLGDVTPHAGTYDLDASGQSITGLVPDVGFRCGWSILAGGRSMCGISATRRRGRWPSGVLSMARMWYRGLATPSLTSSFNIAMG